MALKDGLISYYSLDETSGTRVDLHGSNDLTSINNVNTQTGINGNGADFNGVNQYLEIDDASQSGLDFDTTDQFTVSMWVETDNKNVYGYLVSKYLTTGNQRQWNIQQDGASGQLEINVSQDGGTSNFRVWLTNTGSFTFVNNTLYHIIVKVDATTDTAIVNIDNTVRTTTKSLGAVGSINNGTGDFVIGGRDGGLSLFNGTIDEVALWNRLTTDTEDDDLWNGGAGKFYADFDGGAAAPTFIPRVSMF